MTQGKDSDIQRLLTDADRCFRAYTEAHHRDAFEDEQMLLFYQWYQAALRLEKALDSRD